MTDFSRRAVTAVLGPTNTGKTHLAVERLCGHSSGIMGFPLRLLAREIYDRVVAIKGEAQVGLVTGEERIVPPKARYLLCTVESMPVLGDLDAAFVAIDEAQLGIDPERGHVFTDRMLHARGREETMILGSESLAPMVRGLVPDAEIISRPRFSTLSYAGAAKLSRLPRRSAIVAFSADDVYAIAETVRRIHGGAAVVMGALSPATRNAQVEMFQRGEVDYLVATDAIGMGLNLDVRHVAFASLVKFDGKRRRRLTVAEMAQIAGRAGRHHQDGSFGFMGSAHANGFTPEEIEAIEQHRFPRIETLFWRDGAPRFDDLETLIRDLEAPPRRTGLKAAPQSVDLAVLKRLAADPGIAGTADTPEMVARLWDACGLPDFQKTGAIYHARTIERLWAWRGKGDGRIPADWFLAQVERLDTVDGDVETLAGRIAAARTWAYIAHRADWLDSPAEMAHRTRELEARLSDALHERLTRRFVDTRTSLLLKGLGQDGALPVTIGPQGDVMVGQANIGQLEGFRFTVDQDARGTERKRLLAAAEKHLGDELASRAAALAADPDDAFELAGDAGAPVELRWLGSRVAILRPGRGPLTPEIALDSALKQLDAAARTAIAARLRDFLDHLVQSELGPVAALVSASQSADAAPAVRALLVPLAAGLGIAPRAEMDAALAQAGELRKPALHAHRITTGSLDLYMPVMLKPAAARLRTALLAVEADRTPPPLPEASVTVLSDAAPDLAHGARAAGFRNFAAQWIRIDMVEKIARAAHEARVAAGQDAPAFAFSDDLRVSLGIADAAYAALMRALGFRTGAAPAEAPKPADSPSRDTAEPASQDTEAVLVSDETIAPEVADSPPEKEATPSEDAAPAPPAPRYWTWRGRQRARPRTDRGAARSAAHTSPRAKPRDATQRSAKPLSRGKPAQRGKPSHAPKPPPKSGPATANPFADLKSMMAASAGAGAKDRTTKPADPADGDAKS